MKNKLIFDFFYIVDSLNQSLQCDFDRNNKYKSILLNLKEISKEKTINISSLRKNIEEFIIEVNLDDLNSFIQKNIKNDKKTLLDLTDNELLFIFVKLTLVISYTQHPCYENLILLKYNKQIYETNFNDFTNVCRGKVFDTKTKKIVSYGWDKFFNVNEKSYTTDIIVEENLKKATYICLSDKKDGSTIVISPTHDYGKLVHTNGGFFNEQIDKAISFLVFKNKYQYFNESLYKFNDKYTFIFEIIYPENKIVLDYGEKEELILIGIRDLETHKVLTYEEMFDFAQKYHLEITQKESFNQLDDLLRLGKELSNANKEGWVLRIDTLEEQFFYKIKLEEYFNLHKNLTQSISNRKLYELYQNNEIDDILPYFNAELRELIEKDLREIAYNIDKFKDIVLEEINSYKNKIKFTPKEIYEIKSNRNHPCFLEVIDFIKYLKKGKSIISEVVNKYYLSGEDIDDILQKLCYKDYLEIKTIINLINKKSYS